MSKYLVSILSMLCCFSSVIHAQSAGAGSTALHTPIINSLLLDEDIVQPTGQCNDGIDNDGDGLTDWQFDLGCYNSADGSERAGSRLQENGWTTFDLSVDSQVIYVSSSTGDDANDGLTPATAVATPERGFALTRSGFPDVLLLKRGDRWRDTALNSRFHLGGRSANEKMIIASYGNSTRRPRLEIKTNFINDNGREFSNVAVQGLAFISYKKQPNTPEYDGTSGGAVRFVGNARSRNILLEDNYVEYGEFIVQSVDNIQLRRNVIYRSYHAGTCRFNADGTRNPHGNSAFRPSGMFMGSGTNTALLEGNVWDENGWNPDIPVGPNGACATIFNHNVYLSDVKNVTVRNNLFLRASSIGLKVSGNSSGGVDGLRVDNNLFAEGEIGIAMGGNSSETNTHNNSVVSNNVFTDIARTKPTTRAFTWGITVENNNNTVYENNYFVNPLDARNGFSFGLGRDFNTDVTIRNNITHGYNRALRVASKVGWDSVQIQNNTFFTQIGTGPLITHQGNFDDVSYSGNDYFSNYTSSSANSDGWFDNGFPFLNIGQWRTRSGETNAAVSTYSPSDPGRNVDSYAAQLGIGSTLADFAREARKQSRFNYRPEYEADAVNAYIRQGYAP